MKRITLAFLILLGAYHLQAQKLEFEPFPLKQNNTALRLGVISPGITLEQRLGERFSLSGKLGTGISISIEDIDTPDPLVQARLIPYVSLEPRYYLGIYERELEGKHKEYFSGLYIGLPVKLRLLEPGYIIGPTCGFQTSLRRKAYFKSSVGLAYTTIEDYSYIVRMFCEVELGFILH